ncbi:embryonic abundant protein VF30.1-like [Vicia villosa]|uniref:embryonic abundant protein VF30.1-like n=1 Tax=Vicia villosa TaxID=3911 RepID=UPI00273BD5AB|nr:embryonic abundant protein VF30.1-like [Vicia villosa]
MEFKSLSVLALFLLTLLGINGFKSEEEYWKSVWPNTPIPKALSDLLLSDKEVSIPIKSHEEKQYWTVFFEHDLYPGKTMNLGIPKHSDIQSSKSTTPVPVKNARQTFKTRKGLGQTHEKENQPFGLTIKSDKTKMENIGTNQPFGTFVWWHKKETETPNQPCGLSVHDKKEVEKENQPFGTFVWWHKRETEKEKKPFGFRACYKKEIEKENQPFGTFVWWHKRETEKEKKPFEFSAWDRKNTKKENQPFGFSASYKNEVEKQNQPFGTFVWWHKKEAEKAKKHFEFSAWDKKESEKENQPFVAHTLDEKEVHILNNYCGTPSAIGEDKHCASSLESMMDFAISKLGKNIKVMSSSFSQSQDQYVVEDIKKIGDKAVMCHRLNFKKVVFYCHTINATTTYMVPLVASDGTKSKALTICHHDTRGMNPNVLHEVLNVKQENVPICHFIGNKAIAWVPNVSESRGNSCVI